jgi:hypothetical protein
MIDKNTKTLLKQYVENRAFRACDTHFVGNPWHRPLAFEQATYDEAIKIKDVESLNTTNSYMLNKVLFNIYEQQTPFLPNKAFSIADKQDYDALYNRQNKAIGQALQTPLEDAVFDFLFAGIEKKSWTAQSLMQHMSEVMACEDVCPLAFAEVMDDITHKDLGAKMYLLHKASDFLTEGSAMPKVLTGNTGELQMSLTRVFMDEYGSGDLSRKHSTLFKKAMASIGLSKQPHAHFEDYLPASIMMTNFFHYVCGNPEHFFRYLGAIYFAEASTVEFFRKLTATFRRHDADGSMNLEYFEEHIEVDQKHRQICWQELVVCVLETYGDSVAQELYEGFEAFSLLAMSASKAVNKQVYFADAVMNQTLEQPAQTLTIQRDIQLEDTGTYMAQIADQQMQLHIVSGCLEFGVGNGGHTLLEPGQWVNIPKERMFRMKALQGHQCKVQMWR